MRYKRLKSVTRSMHKKLWELNSGKTYFKEMAVGLESLVGKVLTSLLHHEPGSNKYKGP